MVTAMQLQPLQAVAAAADSATAAESLRLQQRRSRSLQSFDQPPSVVSFTAWHRSPSSLTVREQQQAQSSRPLRQNVDDLSRARRGHVNTRASAPGLADEQEQGRGSGEGSGLDAVRVPQGAMMVPEMKKGYGFGGGGAVLEKSKLDLSYSSAKTSPQVDLGGGSGNNGKGISHGGGDGGDDDGDDDDYFGEDDGDDDGGDDGFIRRGLIAEVFDRASVEAVLQEWFKTINDLPAGLFRAVQMGLVSSAQVARFMSIDARPTIARIVSRITPSEISRAFIGRMMADPAFIFKVTLEQVATIAAAAHWEYKQRGARLKEEWDLALTNVLTVAACNAAIIWCLSPTRSYGTTARSDIHRMLQKLPNHMFDKSYPLREFNMPARAGSFFYKAAELSLVGSVVGGIGGFASDALLKLRTSKNPSYRPSVPVPSVSTSTAAYGAYLGLSGNLRYQLLYGLDRVLQQNFNHIPVAIFGTTMARCGNVLLGEPSRLLWLGLDREAVEQTKAETLAYRRPSADGKPAGARKLSPMEMVGLGGLAAWVGSVVKGATSSGSRAGRPRRQRKLKVAAAAAVAGAAAGDGGADGVAEEVVRKPKRKVKRKVAVAAQ